MDVLSSLAGRVSAARRGATGRWAAPAIVVCAALLLLLALPAAGLATPPTTPDPATWVTDGVVNAIATAADGTTYIGGDFTYVGPTPAASCPSTRVQGA